MSRSARTPESMSELEWLGWETLAQQRLNLRRRPGMARVLRQLVQHRGVALSAERLSSLGSCSVSSLTASSIKVYLCYLREALTDVGLKTVPTARRAFLGWDATYELTRDEGAKVFAFVLGEVA